MNLNSIPSDIQKCINIKRLNLSDNEILTIPLWISSMTNLEYIDLSSN